LDEDQPQSERSAVIRWNATSNKIEPVIADKRLLWPDTLSWGPNGDLYVTASKHPINRATK
jgi:hypothetical protein